MVWLLGLSSRWPELMPTGMSLSPICLKITLRAARRAAVALMLASLTSQSCWIASTVTTSAAVCDTDLRRACAAAAGPISRSSSPTVMDEPVSSDFTAEEEFDDDERVNLGAERDDDV